MKKDSKEQLKEEVNQLRLQLDEMTKYRDGLAMDYLEHKNIIAVMESTLLKIKNYNPPPNGTQISDHYISYRIAYDDILEMVDEGLIKSKEIIK